MTEHMEPNARSHSPAAPAPARDPLLRAVAVAAALFGAVTIYAGGTTLFGPAAGADAAAVVPFVLWFNFLAGFAYMAAGVGLWQRRRWAATLAIVIAVTTLAVFAAFGVHVLRGGAFAPRTVGAMTLRSVVWVAIAWLSVRRLRRAGASAA